MKRYTHAPLLDDLLERWRSSLGDDFTSYRNHCYRVFNFSLALCADPGEAEGKIAIAAAFHDLGIWVNDTFDYIEPSKKLARDYLTEIRAVEWIEEVEAMIEQHHKISAYKAHPDGLIEPFRKADWIDVSMGVVKFGLPSHFLSEVRAAFPYAGFHGRLLAFTLSRLRTHPWSPLPMMKW